MGESDHLFAIAWAERERLTIPFVDQSPSALHAEAHIDVARFLSAVAACETGGNPWVIGAAGERSEYQLTQAVWREETRWPWSRAFNPADAFVIARAHFYTLLWRLRAARIDPTPLNIALAWCPHGGVPRAERVVRLYQSP